MKHARRYKPTLILTYFQMYVTWRTFCMWLDEFSVCISPQRARDESLLESHASSAPPLPRDWHNIALISSLLLANRAFTIFIDSRFKELDFWHFHLQQFIALHQYVDEQAWESSGTTNKRFSMLGLSVMFRHNLNNRKFYSCAKKQWGRDAASPDSGVVECGVNITHEAHKPWITVCAISKWNSYLFLLFQTITAESEFHCRGHHIHTVIMIMVILQTKAYAQNKWQKLFYRKHWEYANLNSLVLVVVFDPNTYAYIVVVLNNFWTR